MPPAVVHFPTANELGISEDEIIRGSVQESSMRQENYYEEGYNNDEINSAVKIHISK
jgi:hypothetical protein